MSGKPFTPNEIDKRLGEIICTIRKMAGLSQKDLSEKLGVTFQQIQKYETADNRISASRLYEFAKALEVPVGTLFREVEAPYMHDKKMREFIQRICMMDDGDKKMIFTLAGRLYDKELPATRPEPKVHLPRLG